MPKQMKPFTED